MKRFLLSIVVLLSSVTAMFGEEVHGLSRVIAKQLSSEYSYYVVKEGYLDSTDTYFVTLRSPDYFDKELSISCINTLFTCLNLSNSDLIIKQLSAWETFDGCSSIYTFYRINDTKLQIEVYDYNIVIYESINQNWKNNKAANKKTNKHRQAKKRRK